MVVCICLCRADKENTLKINVIKPYVELQITRIYDENT